MNDKTEMTVQKSGTGIANLGLGQSVLGQAQMRIPVGGKVRPGIMVLTKAAQESDKARQLYQQHRKAGMPYQDINHLIKTACKMSRNPMTPKNVPYFTVRPGDFKNPDAAQLIMNTYASDKGDGEGPHLYRFPVIFPVDNWQAVLPHEFACFTAGQKLYWSEYSVDGTRQCMTREALAMEKHKNKTQAHRPAGGRKAIPRPDNGGICNPDDCPQYQARECTLTGRILFHIPGIPGADAIELSTRSFYALSEIRQTLEMVGFLHGRISGTLAGKPIFFITKQRQRVSMIDPGTGKPKRVQQWIIAIEADIDMQGMYQAAEAPAMLAAGQAATSALTLDDTPEFDEETGEVINRISTDERLPGGAISGELVDEEKPALDGELETAAEQQADQEPGQQTSAEADLDIMIDDAEKRSDLNEVAAALTGIDDKAVLDRVRAKLTEKYNALPVEVDA